MPPALSGVLNCDTTMSLNARDSRGASVNVTVSVVGVQGDGMKHR